MMNFGGGGLAGIISPFVFGYLIDFTGSWTLPFAGSLCLLLLGAGLAFRMRRDRSFETAVTTPAALGGGAIESTLRPLRGERKPILFERT